MTASARNRVSRNAARYRLRQAGFTLIEVLVATSLLAVGMAVVFGTLRGATRSTERAEQIARRGEQLRAVQGFVRTQLNAALPIAFEFDASNGEASFLRGSADKLEFVGNMPGYLARGGPYLQTLELTSGANGRQLVFRFQMLTTEGAVEAEREPVVLLDGIAEGGFRFRNIDGKSEPGPWEPKWEASTQLPPLVRLDIRFTDPARRWPEFIVATRLGVPFAGAAAVPLAGDAPAGNR
jgi:general secretion pathway protein J